MKIKGEKKRKVSGGNKKYIKGVRSVWVWVHFS